MPFEVVDEEYETRLYTPDPTCELTKGSNFLNMVFATILEEAVIKLCLLDHSNNSLRIYTTQLEMNQLRRLKYGVEILEENDSRQGSLKLIDYASDHLKLDKLVSDRTICKDLLTATYLNLALESNYAPLVKWRLDVEERERDFNLLVEEEIRNRTTRRELARSLRQQRIRFKSAVYDQDVQVTRLKNQLQDTTVHVKTRERYVDRWEMSRHEQNNQQIEDTETSSSEASLNYRHMMECEQRAHNELDIFNYLHFNELVQRLQLSMTQYEKDIEEIEWKFQLKKVQYETQLEERRELEQKLADRTEFIKKWIEFKEERERTRLYNIKMTNAARTVQAWWRGLLVRLALGPYRVKKQSKKKRNKQIGKR